MIEIVAATSILTFAGWTLSQRSRDPYFAAALTLYGFLLGVAVAITLTASQVTGDFASPYLAGSDGEGYFVQALILAQTGISDYQQLIRSNYLGYQLLLAVLFWLFSPTLVVGLVANSLMILASVACVHRATQLLTQSSDASLRAAICFMLTTAHVYYGMVLLKEPALLLSFALILLSVAKIHEERFGARPIVYMGVALAIIISMRATLLVFLAMLLFIVGRRLIRRRASMVLLFIALAVLAAPFAASFTIYSFDSSFVLGTITENTVVSDRLSEGDLDVTGIAGQAGTLFLGLPFYLKLPLFFVPVFVQMMLPFDVWSTQFLTDYAPTIFSRNLNILWLGFVLPWALYTVINLRKVEHPFVGRLYMVGAAYFAFVAVLYGGLIPRYASTALVFMYPAMGYWWARRSTEPIVRDHTGQFFLLYYIAALAAVLGYAALRLLRAS